MERMKKKIRRAEIEERMDRGMTWEAAGLFSLTATDALFFVFVFCLTSPSQELSFVFGVIAFVDRYGT